MIKDKQQYAILFFKSKVYFIDKNSYNMDMENEYGPDIQHFYILYQTGRVFDQTSGKWPDIRFSVRPIR